MVLKLAAYTTAAYFGFGPAALALGLCQALLRGAVRHIRPPSRMAGPRPRHFHVRRLRPSPRSPLAAAASDREDRNAGAGLYPQPFGLQAEWSRGVGPEFGVATRVIQSTALQGGYVQAMDKVDSAVVGPFYPYVRLQHDDGGWTVATPAPRPETDEFEAGVECQPIEQVGITLAYAGMRRRGADERRTGRAEGDLFRGRVPIKS